jgi:hypothetical protein
MYVDGRTKYVYLPNEPIEASRASVAVIFIYCRHKISVF